jgi:methyl-accepting chemotaxis protein
MDMFTQKYSGGRHLLMKKNLKRLLSFRKENDILNQLPLNVALLRNIAGSTEKEFLLVGEKLQEFHQTAKDISQAASEIAEKISGRDMLDIRGELGKMSDVIAGVQGGMTLEKDTVRAILSSFDALRQPLSEFERIVRNLNILCNFIKIEIARLGQADSSFNKLSEDVLALARLIGAKINSLVDQADAAIPSLNRNLSSIENCDARQKDQGRLIFEKIGNNLSVLARNNDSSLKTIQDISAMWRNISRHIGEVVQSLQFHDITRQRVEHVCHSLEELPQKISKLKEKKRKRYTYWLIKNRDGNHDEEATVSLHPRELMADIFELQAAQLQSADRDLNEAAERILGNLRMVATDAAVISEKLILITGRDASGKSSFMNGMERDIHDLSLSARDVAKIKEDLACAMSALSQTALGMSVFMKDMEKISIEMQRLALNARVHAAHIGDRGATLGVLSESIHQLSLDTASKVTNITTHLQSVVENAGKLADLAGPESAGEVIWIQEKFSKILDALQKVETQINARLPQMNQSGVSLAGDIEHLINNLDIHITVSRDIASVNAYLLAAVGEEKKDRRERAAHQKARDLESLSAQYTMQRERETHRAAAGLSVQKSSMGKDAAPAEKLMPAPQAVLAEQEESLGDNVELF